MPHSCAALNCLNRNLSSGSITFFGFPIGNEELLKKWVSSMARGTWKPSKFSKLCSEHFDAKCFLEENGKKVLKPKAVPSIFSDPSYVRRRGKKRKRMKLGRRPRKKTAPVTDNAEQSNTSNSTIVDTGKANNHPPEDLELVSDKDSAQEDLELEPVKDPSPTEDLEDFLFKDPPMDSVPVKDSPLEDNDVCIINNSQEESESDTDRTTSDIFLNEPVSCLRRKLHIAKQEIRRLQESIAKWELLNQALKPETRDPFLIEKLNVIQKDAAQGHANSMVLLNNIIVYAKNPEEIV